MYYGTKYQTFQQIRQALQERKAVLRMAKGSNAFLLREFAAEDSSVMRSFSLQFLLPEVFLLLWFLLYAKEAAVLLATVVYLILPVVAPMGKFLGMALSLFGVMGVFRGWPVWLTSLMLPAFLSYIGGGVFRQMLTRAACRKAMMDRSVFDLLWKERRIAILDDDGVHQFMTREEAEKHRARRDAEVRTLERKLEKKQKKKRGEIDKKQSPAKKDVRKYDL